MNYNYAFRFWTVIFLILPVLVSQGQESARTFTLESGQKLRVDTYQNGIFRIQLNKDGEFNRSLMERYGILNTSLPAENSTGNQNPAEFLLETSEYKLNISKKTGEITITDKLSGKSLQNIRFNDLSEGQMNNFRHSIDEEFKHIKRQEAIIGDTLQEAQSRNRRKMEDQSAPAVVNISLTPEERFYGGGAASRKNIQHRGEILRIWATYQKSDIVTPFIMSTSGWGVYNNTTSMNYFDVGRFMKDNLLVYNTDGRIDFFIFQGKDMYGVIDKYTSLTGRPYLLPQWAYGLAFGGHTSEDMIDLMNDALRFRDEKIPCDIFWIEPQWMEERYDYSTKKYWDLEKFPAEPYWQRETFKKKYKHPYLFINRLHNLGFRLALLVNLEHDFSYEEEDAIARRNGKPVSGTEAWFDHLMKFVDQGVDGFKLDPARTLDEHPAWKYHNALTDNEMHNMNQVLMPKNFYQTFRTHTGRRSFHHYCGGYAGTQHWGASTSGDNGGGKDALYDQLNLGLSGFLNSSADVMEVYHSEYQPVVGEKEGLAGIHLGFFLPWVQINSWFALYHPWFQSPVEKKAIQYYSQLRNRLHPYIYSAAVEGSMTGKPIVRAMPLEFPGDRKTDNMVYQYMFGQNLLVGVFSDSVYLPEGKWINFWTGKKTDGGKTIHAEVPQGKGGPLFIRPGAIIPWKNLTDYVTETPMDTLTLKVYPDGESTYTLYKDDGYSFEYQNGKIAQTHFTCTRKGKNITFTAVKGEHADRLQAKVYRMEMATETKPQRVLLNGRAATSWKWGQGVLSMLINSENAKNWKLEIFN